MTIPTDRPLTDDEIAELRRIAEATKPEDAPEAMRGLLELLIEAAQENARFRTALEKLNGIRDSIIGMQGFNFSEHAYPMVAALNEAGFRGLDYTEARKNLGTLIEQTKAAEAEVERLRAELDRVRGEAESWAAWAEKHRACERHPPRPRRG